MTKAELRAIANAAAEQHIARRIREGARAIEPRDWRFLLRGVPVLPSKEWKPASESKSMCYTVKR